MTTNSQPRIEVDSGFSLPTALAPSSWLRAEAEIAWLPDFDPLEHATVWEVFADHACRTAGRPLAWTRGRLVGWSNLSAGAPKVFVEHRFAELYRRRFWFIGEGAEIAPPLERARGATEPALLPDNAHMVVVASITAGKPSTPAE